MSLPRGWINAGEFVCRDCATDETRQGLRVDDRVASGRECARCDATMPYEARIRLLPDGWSSITAPLHFLPTEKTIRVERSEAVLVERHALVYVELGCSREVGVSVTPEGKVDVWVHDDPHSDDGEPSARWSYEPVATEQVK